MGRSRRRSACSVFGVIRRLVELGTVSRRGGGAARRSTTTSTSTRAHRGAMRRVAPRLLTGSLDGHVKVHEPSGSRSRPASIPGTRRLRSRCRQTPPAASSARRINCSAFAAAFSASRARTPFLSVRAGVRPRRAAHELAAAVALLAPASPGRGELPLFHSRDHRRRPGRRRRILRRRRAATRRARHFFVVSLTARRSTPPRAGARRPWLRRCWPRRARGVAVGRSREPRRRSLPSPSPRGPCRSRHTRPPPPVVRGVIDIYGGEFRHRRRGRRASKRARIAAPPRNNSRYRKSRRG